jgi:protocatechuate 3,4-dioxygenase alpha subunit
MTTNTESIWQTVGPFFHKTLPWEGGGRLAGEQAAGERVRLVIAAFDGAGQPVSDGMVEVWQADASGAFDHPQDDQGKAPDPHFTNFGRVIANAEGDFVIETVLPGPVPGPGNTLQAPHLDIGFFARGIAQRLVTRIYFAGNRHNENDPVLAAVDPRRRPTLIASPVPERPGEWRWNIHLQGDAETAFFSV